MCWYIQIIICSTVILQTRTRIVNTLRQNSKSWIFILNSSWLNKNVLAVDKFGCHTQCWLKFRWRSSWVRFTIQDYSSTDFKKIVLWIKALFIMQGKFSPEIYSALFDVVSATLRCVSKKLLSVWYISKMGARTSYLVMYNWGSFARFANNYFELQKVVVQYASQQKALANIGFSERGVLFNTTTWSQCHYGPGRSEMILIHLICSNFITFRLTTNQI